MKPIAWANRQLTQRQQLGLPPAVRVAELLGPLTEVQRMFRNSAFPYHSAESPWIGPVAVDEQSHRALLFFTYHVASVVVATFYTNCSTLYTSCVLTVI